DGERGRLFAVVLGINEGSRGDFRPGGPGLPAGWRAAGAGAKTGLVDFERAGCEGDGYTAKQEKRLHDSYFTPNGVSQSKAEDWSGVCAGARTPACRLDTRVEARVQTVRDRIGSRYTKGLVNSWCWGSSRNCRAGSARAASASWAAATSTLLSRKMRAIIAQPTSPPIPVLTLQVFYSQRLGFSRYQDLLPQLSQLAAQFRYRPLLFLLGLSGSTPPIL